MIKISNLRVVYGERTVLTDISIELLNGSVTVITGESGSGKSSFLNILGLIQKANSQCTIEYNNQNLLGFSPKEKLDFVKKNIGYVFQQNNLINTLTVYQNVALQLTTTTMGDEEVKNIVLSNLEYVGILELKDKYPSEISGGEEQRVAIARALAMNQQIILADEPTSALDSKNKKIIMSLFEKITKEQGKIVVVATHDLNIVDYADTHFKIQDNSFVECKNNHPQLPIIPNLNDQVGSSFLKPIIKFNKNQKKKAIPKFILIFIGFAISIAIIGTNIIGGFAEKQALAYESIADKSVFVVNDSMGLKSSQDREDLKSFNQEEISKIKSIEGIADISPYFEFPVYGLTKDNVYDNEPQIFEFSIGNRVYQTENMFSVQPFYQADNKEFYFLNKLEDFKTTDIVLSQTFLDENNIQYSILGDTVELVSYIPIKQFNSQIEKQVGETFVEYEYDGNIYVKHIILARVGGILNKSYPYDRSSFGNSFFYDYDEMNFLLSENLDLDLSIQTFDGFTEKKFEFSAYRVEADGINSMDNVIQNIKNVSNNIQTYSISQNIAIMNESIDYAKDIVSTITLVITSLVIGILFFTFFLTNNSRKKQVGILKALGISKEITIGIYVYELAYYAIIIAISSTIISSIAGLVIIGNVIDTTFSIYFIKSFSYSMLLSILCVCLSGLIPIFSAMKFEPVDIIRLNK